MAFGRNTPTVFRAFILLACVLVFGSWDGAVSQDSSESKTSNVALAEKNESKNEKPYRSSVEIFEEYQQKLENLAKKCDERGMTLEAKVTRSNLYNEKDFFFTVPLLSCKKQPEKLPGDASKEQQSWFAALKRLQKQYADETFAVAERLGTRKK